MSGFEVAGIVLGSLPVIVSGLKFYLQGASTVKEWRRYKRPLQQLIAELETSHVIFQNVLEKLLLGVAADDEIDDMIKNPFGSAWKRHEIHHKIREKLWRNPKVFENAVRDMEAAVAELQTSLQISADGTVAWVESAGLKRDWKRVLFILRKDDYRSRIKGIRDGVSRLQILMDLNVELQPERRRRSQGRMLKLVREVSGSIYNAIRMAWVCACPIPHHVGLALKLLSQPESAIPEDDEEDIAKAFDFHLIASYNASPTNSDGHEGSNPSTRVTRQWCEMAIRKAEECLTLATVPISTRPAKAKGRSFLWLHHRRQLLEVSQI
ncbi:hypothetical protein QBC44DRAFT_303151 [Cladorrhinum sp. PSN332]|nr:hypothetical protein QBC44DRAFT_303151 [Cladorrhinum sp. PSN332]